MRPDRRLWGSRTASRERCILLVGKGFGQTGKVSGTAGQNDDFSWQDLTNTMRERLSVKLLKILFLAVSKLAWRIQYEGLENLPNDSEKGFVIASNHQTYIDPVWIGIPIRRDLKFLAWDKAFHWPIIGFLMRWLGSLPVNTSTGRNPDSLKRAVESLQNGSCLVIFPEGAREFENGEPLEFKMGAVALASEAKVHILPASIIGGNSIWPRDWKWPRLGKVTVRFHPMIEVPVISDETRKTRLREITEVLRKIVTESQ